MSAKLHNSFGARARLGEYYLYRLDRLATSGLALH